DLNQPSFKNELHIKHTYRGQRYCFISITDSGIGISRESIGHLFERYYRIGESHLGSGIGLAFVKSLVTLHKGDIYVYSERQKGTEIVIALPCDEQDYTAGEKWNGSTFPSAVRLESTAFNQLSE